MQSEMVNTNLTEISGSSSNNTKQRKRRKIQCIQDFNNLNRSSLSLGVLKNTHSAENTKTKKQMDFDFLPKVGFDNGVPEENSIQNSNKKFGKIISSPANILRLKNTLKLHENLSSTDKCSPISSPQDDEIEFKSRLNKRNVNLQKKKQIEVVEISDSLDEFLYLEECSRFSKGDINTLSHSKRIKVNKLSKENMNFEESPLSPVKMKKSLELRSSMKEISRNSITERQSQRHTEGSSNSVKSFFLNLSPDTFGNTQGIFNITCPFKQGSTDKSFLSLSFLGSDLEKKDDEFQICKLNKTEVLDNDFSPKCLKNNKSSLQISNPIAQTSHGDINYEDDIRENGNIPKKLENANIETKKPKFRKSKGNRISNKQSTNVIRLLNSSENNLQVKNGTFRTTKLNETFDNNKLPEDTSPICETIEEVVKSPKELGTIRKSNTNRISETQFTEVALPSDCLENNIEIKNDTFRTTQLNVTFDSDKLPEDISPICEPTEEVLNCTKKLDSTKKSSVLNRSSKKSVINLITPSPKKHRKSLSTPTPTKSLYKLSETPTDTCASSDPMAIALQDRSLTFIKDSNELDGNNLSRKMISSVVRKRWTKSSRVSLLDKSGDLHLIAAPSLESPYPSLPLSQKKWRALNIGSKLSTPKLLAASTPYYPIGKEKEEIKSSNKKKIDNNSIKKTKMPNFAQIHQRAYDKLENIKEMSERKAARAQKLLSGFKPDIGTKKTSPCKSRKELLYSPAVKRVNLTPAAIKAKVIPTLPLSGACKKIQPKSNIPVFNHVKVVSGKKPQKKKSLEKNGILKPGFMVKKTAAEQDHLKAFANKKPVVTETVDKRRKIIKNVRTNRRFELLMQMRNK